MAGKVRARLRELGITLPDPVAPLADYVPFVRSGSLVFVSGQLPLGPEGLITGRLTAADNCEGEPPAGSMMARARALTKGVKVVWLKSATGFLCSTSFSSPSPSQKRNFMGRQRSPKGSPFLRRSFQ